MAHAIRLQPKYLIEGGERNILKIVGAIGVGGSVQVGSPDAFQCFKVICVEVLTAVEHEVLKQVRKTTLAGFLILGANMVPDVYRYDGGFVIFMHHECEAIVECILFKGDINIRHVDQTTLREHRKAGADQQRCGEDFFHTVGILLGFLIYELLELISKISFEEIFKYLANMRGGFCSSYQR